MILKKGKKGENGTFEDGSSVGSSKNVWTEKSLYSGKGGDSGENLRKLAIYS